jgi:hypothetical protein
MHPSRTRMPSTATTSKPGGTGRSLDEHLAERALDRHAVKTEMGRPGATRHVSAERSTQGVNKNASS